MKEIEHFGQGAALDVEHLRMVEFPVTRHWKFFNHAACSPLSMRATRAMERQIHEHSMNGNLGNSIWAKNREDARALAARLLHCENSEVAFVSNTAEGLSLAANGFRWRAGDNIVTSNVEYPANMYPWLNLAKHGVTVKTVDERQGRIDLADIASAIDDRTRIVTISWVGFGNGFMSDLQALGALCRQRGVFFVVDAIQALGAFPIDVKAAQIDFLACGGQKWLLGPRGCGLVYCSEDALNRLDGSIVGAYSVVDEHDYLDYNLQLKPGAARFEYGTENAVGIAGLRGSLELLLEVGIDTVQQRIVELTERFCQGVLSKDYQVVSSRVAGETSGLVFIEKTGVDADQLAQRLKEARFVLSVRSGRLRFAPHFYNTAEEVDALIDAL